MITITDSIWRDTYYRTSASPFTYSITVDGSPIYTGKAYKMPDAERTAININKICENYLHQSFDEWFEEPFEVTSWSATSAMRNFVLADGDGNELVTYRFLDNWDYDFIWDSRQHSLSVPICDDYAVGMVKFSTSASTGSGVVNYAETIPESAATIDCVDYALYYVNARGGLDSFAIQGATLKRDNIKAYTTDRAFYNGGAEFEKMRNISEINTVYELNTHFLSDEQAEKLAKHLIGSNLVYLHCLKDGTIKPVIITDNQAVYQTYQTNGGKMAQYKITVEESQTKRRRR